MRRFLVEIGRMKISVIIPYWNAKLWLERCINSLKVQLADAEFLLINDGSTDGGPDLARRIADDRFILLENERAKGVSGARNTGLIHAAGDWITFLDADDEMLPGGLQAYIEVLKVYPDARWIQLNHKRYYTAINKLVLKYTNAGGVYELSKPPICWWGVWNKLYRADLIKDVRFDEDLQYGEDGLFNLECWSREPRLCHGIREMAAVKHRFDNPASLSHVKTGAEVLKQIHAYEAFMLRQKDPRVRLFVCQELSRLWGSPTFERTFGNG